MLHFHVSHLAGLFKEKHVAAVSDIIAVLVPLGPYTPVNDAWSLLLSFWLPWTASDTEGKMEKATDQVRTGICVTYQSPSTHCLSTMHWKFALCSWWLHNCPQLLTQRLWATAQWALAVTHLQQCFSRKASSKIPFWLLTAKHLFSYSAQSLLCARSPFQKGWGILIINLFP